MWGFMFGRKGPILHYRRAIGPRLSAVFFPRVWNCFECTAEFQGDARKLGTNTPATHQQTRREYGHTT